MNEEVTPPSAEETNEARQIRELETQLGGVRGAMHILALCGIVIGASFFLFVHKQVEGLQKQSAELMGYLAEYDRDFAPKLELARSNLYEFGKSHPNVLPILGKYFTNAPGPGKSP